MVFQPFHLIIATFAILSFLPGKTNIVHGSGGGSFAQNRLSPAPQIPRVSLSTSSTPVAAGHPVTFAAQLSSRHPNLKYRFAFGDGSQTGWQDSSATTHSYAMPGAYSAYVDIGLVSNGFVRQVGGSLRRPIQVIPAPIGAVELKASPRRGEAGQSVTLNARVVSRNPNVRYRFTFGDGSPPTGWQANPQATHAYSAAGTYPASVDVGVTDGRTIRQVANTRRPVRVTPRPPVAVDLSANTTSVETGGAVTLSARPGSRDGNLRFRFFFGDGSGPTGWQDSPQATHSYKVAGNYPAFVEVGRSTRRRFGTIAKSGVTRITVTSPASATTSPFSSASQGTTTAVSSPLAESAIPIDETSPEVSASPGSSFVGSLFSGGLRNNWWKYLILALLLAFIGYKILRWLKPPPPTFSAFSDPGGAQLDPESEDLAIASQVLLRPNVSEGQYLIYTGGEKVVKNLRRENV